jgi:S1-C subfamily serine protease
MKTFAVTFLVIGIITALVMSIGSPTKPRGEDPRPGFVAKLTMHYGNHSDHGSGVLISDSRVLTCYHNVRSYNHGGKNLLVHFGSMTYTAKIVKVDSTRDLALLSIPPQLILPVEPGEVAKGDEVVIHGFPQRRYQEVAATVVGKASHTRTGPDEVLIMDRPVKGGMSGGPVLKNGKLVGILFGSDDYSRATDIDSIREFLDVRSP